jgi:hypothetical protein
VKIATALSVIVAAGALAVALPAYAKDGGNGNSSGSASGNAGGHDDGKGGVDATPTPTATATATPSVTPAPSPPSDPAPTPVPGKTFVAGKHTGTVRVRAPRGDYVELAAGAAIPVGSVLDTTAGAVVLNAALPGGATNAGSFSGGSFEVRQDAESGVTDVYLRGGSFARCRTRSLASISSTRPKPVRSLWGSDDGGRFRTHGRNSVATVRGTRWLTEDRCEGTLTRVVRGAVDVRDKRTHRRVTVRAGHSYLAHPR